MLKSTTEERNADIVNQYGFADFKPSSPLEMLALERDAALYAQLPVGPLTHDFKLYLGAAADPRPRARARTQSPRVHTRAGPARRARATRRRRHPRTDMASALVRHLARILTRSPPRPDARVRAQATCSP